MIAPGSMTKPSSRSKSIATAAIAAFGGSPRVDRFWDDRYEASVDIVSCSDSPCNGVTSYATIGVSEIPLVMDGKELDVRTELVGACGSQFIEFPNYLSTAGFCVINSGWLVAPDVIFPEVLSMYEASDTMKHLLFLSPSLWGDRLQTLDVEGRKVAWLLAIPISEAEYRYAVLEGVPALEDRFEQHQIDMFDLMRASVV